MGKGRRQETGDNPPAGHDQPTPNPSGGEEGKTGEMGIIEEVGERIIP
ncbi:hypothetical protein [Okeania sp. SIO1I7]|nr:hypothetical protein [Okeania sp. SIO1I7]NET24237.1 hypothetical protein [Okeania sp. SIO1I7]